MSLLDSTPRGSSSNRVGSTDAELVGKPWDRLVLGRRWWRLGQRRWSVVRVQDCKEHKQILVPGKDPAGNQVAGRIPRFGRISVSGRRQLGARQSASQNLRDHHPGAAWNPGGPLSAWPGFGEGEPPSWLQQTLPGSGARIPVLGQPGGWEPPDGRGFWWRIWSRDPASICVWAWAWGPAQVCTCVCAHFWTGGEPGFHQ